MQMRRFYIATGTAVYANADLNLPSVETDLAAITGALEKTGFEKADVCPPINPSREELFRLDQWFNGLRPEDEVVVYYVGHGLADDQHYLLLKDCQFASMDLIRTFARKPLARRVLVVLDTCQSGNTSLDLNEHWRNFENRFRAAEARVTLVTSCRSDHEAKAGAFTPAFADALMKNTGLENRGQEKNALRDLLDGLKLPAWQRSTRTTLPALSGSESEFDFPNPDFDPNWRKDLDLESQRRRAERQAHWDDRVKYFTGRARAVATIEAFLNGEEGGALVVTGDPGSGKSSVLAHVVLNSGKAELAIHAKGRDSEQMLEILSHHFQISIETVAVAPDTAARAKQMAIEIGRLGRAVRILVDALDEALNPQGIIRQLLRPLAEQANVRLVVGTRPDSRERNGSQRFQGLGSAAREVDLDSDAYFAADDIENYARARLAERGAYTTDASLAGEAAKAVAAKSARTFLIAKLECDGLVNLAQALRPDQIWTRDLPADLKSVFREYLERFRGKPSREDVFRVLSPLAFGFGQGQPSLIWEQAATGLAGEPVSAAQIRQVLETAGAYVVESTEGGTSVYRLFHATFSEFFREEIGEADGHSRILTALSPKDGKLSNPYTARHLALHAESAGRLDEILETPAMLLTAEPSILRPLAGLGLAKSTEAVRNSRCYLMAAHLMKGELADRAAHLALAANKLGARTLVRQLQELGATCFWWPKAAQWQKLSPHSVIEKAHDAVQAVAIGKLGDRTVIASGGDDRLIRLWDGETLAQIGEPLVGFDHQKTPATGMTFSARRSSSIEALNFAKSQDGRCYLLALSQDGRVARWDLETLERATVGRGAFRAIGIGKVDGRFCVVCEMPSPHGWTTDQRIEIREFDTWAPMQSPTGNGDSLCCAKGAGLFGRPLFWCGEAWFRTDRRSIRSWKREVQEVEFAGPCYSVGVGTIDGAAAVLIGGDFNGRVTLLDGATYKPLGVFLGNQNYVDAVAVGEIEGTPVVVSGSRDGSVRLWPKNSMEDVPFCDPNEGLRVGALGVTDLADEWLVVTGGHSQKLRAWSGETLELVRKMDDAGDVLDIAIGSIGDKVAIATASDDGWGMLSADSFSPLAGQGFDGNHRGASGIATCGSFVATVIDSSIWIWDAASSKKIAQIEEVEPRPPLAIAGSILVYGSRGSIYFWDLNESKLNGSPISAYHWPIKDFALGQFQGRTLLASASSDGTVRLLDVETRKFLGRPIEGPRQQLFAVALGRWNDRTIVAAGGYEGVVYLWDVLDQSRMSTIPVGSHIYELAMHRQTIIAGCATGLMTVELR